MIERAASWWPSIREKVSVNPIWNAITLDLDDEYFWASADASTKEAAEDVARNSTNAILEKALQLVL